MWNVALDCSWCFFCNFGALVSCVSFDYISYLKLKELLSNKFTSYRWQAAFLKDGISGPTPLPLFGNSLFALRHLRTIHHHLFKKEYEGFGPIARVWLVGMLVSS